MVGRQLSLLLPHPSPLHRLPSEVKLVSAALLATAVAFTPRRAVAALLLDAVVIATLLAVSGYGVGTVLRRATAIVPFLLLAAFIPLFSAGDPVRLDPLPATVTVEGLWAGWNTAAKTILGFGVALVLAGTTSPPDLVRGLDRLRVPATVVAVVSFMFRYLELLVDEMGRMRTAMVARGHDPRWLWQARPLASAAGALFVRSYERGERVHGAMLARGFTGRMPMSTASGPTVAQWAIGLAVAAVPAAALLAALVTGYGR